MKKKWFTNGVIQVLAEECPEGFRPGRLPVSEETRKKHSEHSGWKTMSEEAKAARAKKISDTIQNRTDEEKKQYSETISAARKGKGLGNEPWNKGKTGCQEAWNKGIPCSEETKEKIKATKQNKSPEEKAAIEQKRLASRSYGGPWNKGIQAEHEPCSMQDDLDFYLSLVQTIGFPVPTYTKKQLQHDYNQLRWRFGTISNLGLKIVKQFHPSIWRCNVKNHPSPGYAWYNKSIMRKVIENRLKYLKTGFLSPQNLITGLSVTKLAPKVSIFRPMTAKYLINKYLSDSKTIFDPCAGFSGRMLGTCVLGKCYIGQDINSTTIREAKELRDYFKLDAELRVKDSLYDTGEYEALFTCPPYGDKECWYQDIEVFSADEWITTCLKNYKCKAYLFVVDKTDLYKDFIAEELPNKSHFGINSEKVILIKK